MTISSSVRTAGPFTGNGATTIFPFAFKVFQASDLLVARTDTGQAQTTLALSADYTVALNSDQNASPGGYVTLLAALPLNYSLTITSNIALLQPLSLTNQGGFFPKNIEDEFDRLTILQQQLGFNVSQTLRVPEVGGASTLPPATTRANRILGFDSNGTPTAIVPTPGDASALALDLASTNVATKGSGQVGFNPTLNYSAGTTGNRLMQMVLVRDKGATGDGATDDYVNVANADALAAAQGAVLVITRGTYVMNTSYAFTAPVMMIGGVISGTGTASFPAGFSAAPYYCFDCLVGYIRAEAVYAEWFGARQSNATPTSTGKTTVGKAWNAWPSFVYSGGVAQPNQNYGDATFLGANLPFANGDTWDFIAIQRALWSIGVVTTRRGEVRLFPGAYTLNRAVRWVAAMSTTMRGAGRTKTVLQYNDYTTHEIIAVSAGNSKVLLDFYKIGTDPTFVADLGLIGPSGYAFGASAQPLYLAAVQGGNGLTFENCWITTGDACIYLDSSSSDIWVRHCTFEYGANQVYGFDAATWIQIESCGFWWASGTTQTGVNMAGYAFITGSTFVSLDVPYQLGLGSHVSGCTLIQRTTGYRTTVNGRMITRHLLIPVGGSVVVATFTMATYSALTTRMRVGGVVQGAGGAGLYRELSWYRDNAAPAAAVITATTKFGNATAQGLIGEGTATTATSFSLSVANTGAGAQTYECDVTLLIEGSDFIVSGLV